MFGDFRTNAVDSKCFTLLTLANINSLSLKKTCITDMSHAEQETECLV